MSDGDDSHMTKVDVREESSEVERATRQYMLYVLLPCWFVPGILDWIWHRDTHIERTSGTRESAIHALMMTEIGVPILMGLLLEINAGTIALMFGAAVIHELTAFWDVSYATSRRLVKPREQHTHSLLEVLPLAALGFVTCLHANQTRALFGVGRERPRFAFRLKRPPLSKRYLLSLFGAIAVSIVLPYGEELLRCLRVDGSFDSRPIPPNPPDLEMHRHQYEADATRREARLETTAAASRT